MKILVIGGGAREHAIIWKLRQNKKIKKIYCTSGNAGIAELAECINITATAIDSLINFAQNNMIDLTIVGPDDPLALGIVDEFEKAGLKIFGPNKSAARLEASKAFAKDLMKKYQIPTANYEVFDNLEKAQNYTNNLTLPIVIKADGLALGKGVYICNDRTEVETALKEIMLDKKFGTSGSKVVIEEFLIGEEVSVLAFVDGKTIVPTVAAKDHKRIYDHDQGPNTGGMGTISPVKAYSKVVAEQAMQEIFIPTIKALNNEGITYKGIIFFGLIITKEGPKVIEYNARFGDPETQVVLPKLETDLLEIIEACINGNLDKISIKWQEKAAICVVLAAEGYPGSYQKGLVITGLELISNPNTIIFHAGTKKEGQQITTNGGRVLGVTCLGNSISEVKELVYEEINKINFKGKQYRQDIWR